MLGKILKPKSSGKSKTKRDIQLVQHDEKSRKNEELVDEIVDEMAVQLGTVVEIGTQTPSTSQSVNKTEKTPSKPPSTSSCSTPDGLNWFHEPRIPYGAHPDQYREQIFPLVPPIHLGQFIGTVEHQLYRPVDYFIAWADQLSCCGFIKEAEDTLDTVPLIMRFGGYWNEKATKSMYVGCTVRVKSYVNVKELHQGSKLAEIQPLLSDKKTFLYAGIPNPTGFAYEWAVVTKPNIVRSLGILKEDNSYEKGSFRHLRGVVKDVEYNEEHFACPEKWPIPRIKKLPPIGSAVVLNYVEIVEPHVILTCRDKQLLLPAYISNHLRTSEPLEKTYFFAWLDLTFEPHRVYE